MIILGIDPGLATTGWGVIEKKVPNQFTLVDFGCIRTDKDVAHPERLLLLAQELAGLVKKFKPSQLAVEELFFHKNVKTAIKVSEARGVVLLIGTQLKLKIEEFTPLQVKQALAGYGRADKKQIQQMVKLVLDLKKVPKPDDAADALAVAITAGQTRKF